MTALLPRDAHEHPRVAVTIPCAILARILRDHLGRLRTICRPRQWHQAAVAQRGCATGPRHHVRREGHGRGHSRGGRSGRDAGRVSGSAVARRRAGRRDAGPAGQGERHDDPCWSLTHGRLNPFRCRVELSAVTRREHEVDCARGCRRIDVLQPCPVGRRPPAGADGARRSHDDRTAQRHPVKSFSIRAPMPVSPTPAQARSAESVDQADSERQERPDCVNRNEPGEQGCTMPTNVPTSVPGRIAWPAHARAGSCRCRPQECVRLPSAHRGAPPLAAHPNGTTTTATATCTDRDAMQPRFPVNDRTPGTGLAVCLAGTGRDRRHETHDGRGAATTRIRPAFNPTVGAVTGTSPRYGNRSRRRTSRRSRR